MEEKKFSYKNAPVASRKAGLILDLIKNKPVEEALVNLEYNDKKASKLWFKLIKSGLDYFEKNGMKDVKISEAYVGNATSFKRHRMGGRGTVKPYKKRRAHLFIKLKAEEADTKGKSKKSTKS